MKEAPRWRRYLRFLGPDWRADNAEEIAFHLASRVEALVAEGVPEGEARERAAREFGDVRRVAEELEAIGRRRWRRSWRLGVVADLLADIRHAVRGLGRQRVYAAAMLLTLSLVIGATATMFSLVDSVLLRRLPFPDPERLAVVWERNTVRERPENVVSVPNYEAWRERSQSFASLAALVPDAATLQVGGAERVSGAAVTASWFDVVGVPPALGRGFTEEDERDEARVIVLSDGLWREVYGSRSEVVGETIQLTGVGYTVVGVMPAGFDPPAFGWLGSEQRYWLPFTPTPANREWGRFLLVLGRLRPGAEVGAADRELKRIAEERAAETVNGGDWTVDAVELHQQVTGAARPALLLLLGAAVLLFMLGVVNVLNLVLARAQRRSGEFVVRAAIGADRSRLLRQLLAEGLTIALLAAPLGALLAYGGVEALSLLLPGDTPRRELIELNGRGLLLCLLAASAAAIVIGTVPALRVLGLRDRFGMTPHRYARTSPGGAPLVIGQVAFALVLAVGAGLAVRTFVNLRSVPLGFDTGVIVAEVAAPSGLDDARLNTFYSTLLDRFAALPGVESAAAINVRPLDSGGTATRVWPVGDIPDGSEAVADLRTVSSTVFSTLGVELLRGDIPPSDASGRTASPVLVNQTMARLLWGSEDEAVGRPVVISLNPLDTAVVAGVVEDVHLAGPDEPIRSTVYGLYPHDPTSPMDILVRTGLPAASTIPLLREALSSVDPSLPLYDVRTLGEAASASTAQERINSILLSGISLLALILAALGIYGVLALEVGSRERELAVRMALGSSAGSVRRRVLLSALKLSLAGTALGPAGALALTRFMASILYGVSATDAATYAAVTVLLIGVAMMAAIVPARRAASVAPMEILRGS